MRGKARCHADPHNKRGITPAHAGKRSHQKTKCLRNGDHPRACGEKCVVILGKSEPLGSPPRMRGKEKDTKGDSALYRITPAHAGKSRGGTGGRSPRKDHPRACGEKAFLHMAHFAILGSPPRMRGKVHNLGYEYTYLRITPAHAGKSKWCLRHGLGYPGSPPRMRGKAWGVLYSVCKRRITPAHAGKSCFSTGNTLPCWDHPRACGEKDFTEKTDTNQMGSPPRMRGKVHKFGSVANDVGITPAHAGKRIAGRYQLIH